MQNFPSFTPLSLRTGKLLWQEKVWGWGCWYAHNFSKTVNYRTLGTHVISISYPWASLICCCLIVYRDPASAESKPGFPAEPAGEAKERLDISQLLCKSKGQTTQCLTQGGHLGHSVQVDSKVRKTDMFDIDLQLVTGWETPARRTWYLLVSTYHWRCHPLNYGLVTAKLRLG